jgi:plastocyanin
MKKYTLFASALLFMAVAFSNIPARAVKHVVLVGNYFFNPSAVNVSVGDTVRWVWSAGSHTTTSGTIPGGAASWDEPITSSNNVYEYKVTVAGTYNYVCTPHAGMGMTGTFTATGFVPTLSVAPSNRNVTATAGTTTFSVISNSSWTLSGNAGWCTVGAGGPGSGNGTITATYEANPTNLVRVATITVTVSGIAPLTVTVTQAASTVGMDEQKVNSARVYPNPSKGSFKLNTGNPGSLPALVTIMDISGKSILTRACEGSDEYSFDLSQEPGGYYFVRVNIEGNSTVLRVMLID